MTAPTLVQIGSQAGAPQVRLDRPVTIVGSKPDCDVRLASPQVSGAHALLVTLNGRTYVRDLVSRTGVFVQGRPVQEAVLRHGDRIRIGEFQLEFRAAGSVDTGGAPSSEPLTHSQEAAPSDAVEPVELIVDGYDAPPVPVEGPIFLIGRREGAELTLEDERLSSAHAVIIESGGRWHIHDLGSRSGTFVNEVRTLTAVLSGGDVIRLGSFLLRCQTAKGGARGVAANAPAMASPASAAPQSGPAQKAVAPRKGPPTPTTPAPTTPTPAPAAAPAASSHAPGPPPATAGAEKQVAPPEPAPAVPAVPAVPPPRLEPPALRPGIEQCRRCGFYLKRAALYCPACGSWRRRAYVLLAGCLLLLAVLGLLAAVWLPRVKSAPPPRAVSRQAAPAGTGQLVQARESFPQFRRDAATCY